MSTFFLWLLFALLHEGGGERIVFLAHFSVSPVNLTFSEGVRMSLSYSVGQTNSAIFSQRSGLGPSLGKLTGLALPRSHRKMNIEGI